LVEELLDSGAVEEWRVEHAEAKAEKRIRAVYQEKLKRLISNKKRGVLTVHRIAWVSQI
jgi:hypothetical protein